MCGPCQWYGNVYCELPNQLRSGTFGPVESAGTEGGVLRDASEGSLLVPLAEGGWIRRMKDGIEHEFDAGATSSRLAT